LRWSQGTSGSLLILLPEGLELASSYVALFPVLGNCFKAGSTNDLACRQVALLMLAWSGSAGLLGAVEFLGKVSDQLGDPAECVSGARLLSIGSGLLGCELRAFGTRLVFLSGSALLGCVSWLMVRSAVLVFARFRHSRNIFEWVGFAKRLLRSECFLESRLLVKGPEGWSISSCFRSGSSSGPACC
jgi:hypothetical protein